MKSGVGALGDDLRRRLEQNPAAPGIWLALSRSAEAAGQSAEALRCLRMAYALRHLAEHEPELAALARHCLRTGNRGQAARLAARAGIDLPVADAGDADQARRSGKWAVAEGRYLHRLAADPADVSALRGLSIVQMRQGRSDEALDACRAALLIDSGQVRTLLTLARSFLDQGHPEQAQPILAEIFARDSHVRGAARLWAEIQQRLGQHQGALEAWTLAAAETPADAGLVAGVARRLWDAGQEAAAIPWLRRWQGLAPTEAEAGRLLAAALGRRRPLPAALDHDERLTDALYRVPVLAGGDFSKMSCVRLTGGNLNTVFRVDVEGRSLAVRLSKYPRQRWDAYWEERHNMGVAHRQGLAPEILFFDIADGTLVMPFVPGQSGSRMSNPDFLAKVAGLFRTLHHGPAFRGLFDPLTALDWREERVAGLVPSWAPDLETLRTGMRAARAALAASFPGLAPCHNDPIIGNVIDSRDGVVMIDWQTAAMADPDSEIGAFLARISPDGDLRWVFLAACYGRADHPRAYRARLWEALARYIEIIEAVQMGVDDPADTGWVLHGTQARETLRRLLDDGTVTEAIAALGQGGRG
jgi:tetratricopeptide (TPR) repeat protein